MKLAVTSLWLLIGAALTGAAYWTFLITPESTQILLFRQSRSSTSSCSMESMQRSRNFLTSGGTPSSGVLRTRTASVSRNGASSGAS